MQQHIQAVYEAGVLKPLEPLELVEHEVVSLVVERADGVARQEAPGDFVDFVEELSRLPHAPAQDGFSGADHDRILYGEP